MTAVKFSPLLLAACFIPLLVAPAAMAAEPSSHAPGRAGSVADSSTDWGVQVSAAGHSGDAPDGNFDRQMPALSCPAGQWVVNQQWGAVTNDAGETITLPTGLSESNRPGVWVDGVEKITYQADGAGLATGIEEGSLWHLFNNGGDIHHITNSMSIHLNCTGDAAIAKREFAVVRPSVNFISPGSGPASGGTHVTISGSGFSHATSVSFDNVVVTAPNFTVVDDHTIALTTPPSRLSGVWAFVTVQNKLFSDDSTKTAFQYTN